MPADASIYGMLRPLQQQPGPLDQYAQGMQIRHMLDQGDVANMQRQKMMRDMQEEEAFRSALQGASTVDEATIGRLMGVSPTRAMALQKQMLEGRKTRADIGKSEAEAAAKVIDTHRNLLGGVQDQASYNAWRAGLIQSAPGLAGAVPEQFTPQTKMALLMKADDLLKRLSPELSQRDIGGRVVNVNPYTGEQVGEGIAKTATPGELLTDERTRSEGAANRGVTIRGQNLSAETTRRGQDMGGRTYDADRGVVVDTRAVTAAPVTVGGQPLGAKNKELTDAQAKALLFGDRMQKSDAILAELAQKGVNVSTPGSRSGYGVGATVNVLNTGDRQRLDQAKRDFINAVLRRESGAVISQQEFDNAEQQYFPQVGDSETVRAQKAANRKTAIDGIMAEVPEARRPAAPAPKAPAAPKLGERRDGYIYRGGNPADQKSWEKVG